MIKYLAMQIKMGKLKLEDITNENLRNKVKALLE